MAKSEKKRAGGAVVYRRLEPGKKDAGGARPLARSPAGSRIAPTLRPLLVGFALLLMLVVLLGLFSVRAVNRVENNASLLQSQQTGRVKLLLKLYAAALKLNNEARVRAEAESRRELRPPFDNRLRVSRNDLANLLPQLEHLPLEQLSNWHSLRDQLTAFVETTKNPEGYALNGFDQFRDIQTRFDVIEKDLETEQDKIIRQIEELRNATARELRLIWLITVGIGLLVVAATVWEVQRRYRHERESIIEARRERQFSNQMLEGMVSAVAAIDARGHIRSANAAFFALYRDAHIGASVYDNLASPEAMKMLAAAIAGGETEPTYHGRWVLNPSASPSERTRTFDLYSSPLDMDGEEGKVVTLVDATEAAEAEAVMRRTEALAAVGEASAQVAHEIKNPLGSIRLGVSMLRDMTADAESLNTIDLVERGIDHLNKLVVDVTQFARRKPLESAQVELHQLLDTSLELVADRIREQGTPVEKHYSAEHISGMWDEDQLRQVFVNLLANAIDAGAEGSPVAVYTERSMMDISPGAREADNGQQSQTGATSKRPYARISIEDKGAGMDEATRERIFEPFFTTKKRGTGLGLAIVKQIVEQHGGAINVASTEGEGTRFTVDLPLNLTAPE